MKIFPGLEDSFITSGLISWDQNPPGRPTTTRSSSLWAKHVLFPKASCLLGQLDVFLEISDLRSHKDPCILLSYNVLLQTSAFLPEHLAGTWRHLCSRHISTHSYTSHHLWGSPFSRLPGSPPPTWNQLATIQALFLGKTPQCLPLHGMPTVIESGTLREACPEEQASLLLGVLFQSTGL